MVAVHQQEGYRGRAAHGAGIPEQVGYCSGTKPMDLEGQVSLILPKGLEMEPQVVLQEVLFSQSKVHHAACDEFAYAVRALLQELDLVDEHPLAVLNRAKQEILRLNVGHCLAIADEHLLASVGRSMEPSELAVPAVEVRLQASRRPTLLSHGQCVH